VPVFSRYESSVGASFQWVFRRVGRVGTKGGAVGNFRVRVGGARTIFWVSTALISISTKSFALLAPLEMQNRLDSIGHGRADSGTTAHCCDYPFINQTRQLPAGGASLQWELVFSGSQSSVGASLQWEGGFSGCVFSGCVFSGCVFSGCVFSGCVFSGCVFSGAIFSGVRVFSGASSVAASLQWVPLKLQEKDYKLNIIVYSINQDIKRCFNVF
jgi:hypothetical protein